MGQQNTLHLFSSIIHLDSDHFISFSNLHIECPITKMSMDLDNGVMMSSIMEQQRKFHEEHEKQWQHMQMQLRTNGKVAPVTSIGYNGNKPLMIDVDKANDDSGKAKDIDIAVEGKEAGNGKNGYRAPPTKQMVNPENDIWPRRRKSELVIQ